MMMQLRSLTTTIPALSSINDDGFQNHDPQKKENTDEKEKKDPLTRDKGVPNSARGVRRRGVSRVKASDIVREKRGVGCCELTRGQPPV